MCDYVFVTVCVTVCEAVSGVWLWRCSVSVCLCPSVWPVAVLPHHSAELTVRSHPLRPAEAGLPGAWQGTQSRPISQQMRQEISFTWRNTLEPDQFVRRKRPFLTET